MVVAAVQAGVIILLIASAIIPGASGNSVAPDGGNPMVANNTDIEQPDFPPLSPAGETTAPEDDAFVDACWAELDQIRALGDIQTGANSLTINKIWGPVFRVDFTFGNEPIPGFINRVICWRLANNQIGMTYAIGQAIPPLSAR